MAALHRLDAPGLGPVTATVGRISLGKILISASAVFAGVGPYLADWNETHIYKPTWPPHAKFHNAQTMSLGGDWPEPRFCNCGARRTPPQPPEPRWTARPCQPRCTG